MMRQCRLHNINRFKNLPCTELPLSQQCKNLNPVRISKCFEKTIKPFSPCIDGTVIHTDLPLSIYSNSSASMNCNFQIVYLFNRSLSICRYVPTFVQINSAGSMPGFLRYQANACYPPPVETCPYRLSVAVSLLHCLRDRCCVPGRCLLRCLRDRCCVLNRCLLRTDSRLCCL